MMQHNYIHVNIKVSGSVQGVGFRYAALREAVSIGIRGTVRNLSDGAVFIEAEGTRDQLDEFAAWCNEGPTHATVESIEIAEGKMKDFSDFNILI